MCVIIELVSAAPEPFFIPAALMRKAEFGSRATTRFTSVTPTAASRSASTAAPTAEGDRDPNIYGITVSSFADPNFPPPTFSVWEEVMHPWLGVTTATEHFPQGRPPTC